jgi:hypothetical protein
MFLRCGRDGNSSIKLLQPSIKSLEDQGLLLSDIQRLTKLFKSYRCALDLDRGCVNGALNEAHPRNKVDDDDYIV